MLFVLNIDRVTRQDPLIFVHFKTMDCMVYKLYLSQFSSVAQRPALWDPMNCSTPGLPFHHQLTESTQTHVYWVGDAIQPSHPLSSPAPPALPQSFPASESFQMSQLFASGGQSIGVSASASVLPMNIIDPL